VKKCEINSAEKRMNNGLSTLCGCVQFSYYRYTLK